MKRENQCRRQTSYFSVPHIFLYCMSSSVQQRKNYMLTTVKDGFEGSHLNRAGRLGSSAVVLSI